MQSTLLPLVVLGLVGALSGQALAKAPIKKATARLVVKTHPPAAGVVVKGPKRFKSLGRGPWRRSGLTPGIYQVVATALGYGRVERSVTLRADDSKTLTIRLARRAKARGISGGEIGRLQRLHRHALRRCHHAALRRDKSLNVSARILIHVTPAGRVHSVAISRLGDAGLKDCLRGNVMSWRFDPLGGSNNQAIEFGMSFRG